MYSVFILFFEFFGFCPMQKFPMHKSARLHDSEQILRAASSTFPINIFTTQGPPLCRKDIDRASSWLYDTLFYDILSRS